MPIDYKAKAEKVTATYRLQLEEIRGNNDLNARAKARRIKNLYKESNDELKRLEAANEKQKVTHRQVLERKVWGPPVAKLTGSDAISWRDAEDRAAKLIPDYSDPSRAATDWEGEARAKLERAISAGDDFQVRAIVNVAMQWRWLSVVDAYADTSDCVDEISELWNTTPAIDNPQAMRNEQFDWDFLNFNVTAPEELGQPSEEEETAKDRSDRIGKDFAAALMEGQSEGNLTAGFGGQAGFGSAPGSVNSAAHDAGSWGVE
ncbi:hypothetical protein ACQR3V_25180 [Rhodococcus erythropolis]|uniref:hypothetical protein n=1 Tax=Rhodococcus erythropolis TaxID=1833 RepID=UPI003D0AD0EB